MTTRNDRKVPWILSYRQRFLRSKKLRDTEKEIKQARHDQDWGKVTKLGRLIRRVWWGIKRYKDK